MREYDIVKKMQDEDNHVRNKEALNLLVIDGRKKASDEIVIELESESLNK